jgi:hypothetical protein
MMISEVANGIGHVVAFLFIGSIVLVVLGFALEAIGAFGDFFFSIGGKMKLFNSFQLVCLFAAFPFIIQWLSGLDFRGDKAAMVAACAAYVVLFSMITWSAYDSQRKDGPWDW